MSCAPARGDFAALGSRFIRESASSREECRLHGAAPTRFMVHIAIHPPDDDGKTVTWGDHVTDEEYTAAPSADA